jgi:signal transduction histidine kinase
MERMRGSVLRGLAAFRWLAWMWMATVLVLARGNLVAPVAAVVLVGVALGVTVWLTVLLRRAPERLVTGRVVGVEVGVALALQLADGFVYRAGHVFTPEQPLGVAWPLASVMAAGIAFGPFVGAGTGLLLGAGRATSSTLNVTPDADPMWGVLLPEQLLSLVTTSVLFALAGGVAGYAVRLIVDAESRAAAAERSVASLRAREDVARRLHDGVLQTLAVVERRSDDPQLARLARDQERDLRSFLFGVPASGVVGAGALGDALRAAADRYETAFEGRTQVLVPDDLPELDAEVVEAVAAVVGEALTNAGKHASAERVVVYVEPTDDGVVVSVRDDGVGFDPAAVTERVGLARSIRGRVEELGGQVDVATAPGRGTEVRFTVPH